jgi:putative nucleotidyltransferase with HDIG domain
VGKQAADDTRLWHARPTHAFLVRALAFALPIALSVVVGSAVSRLLAHPGSGLGIALWWLAVLSASTATLYGADKVARRLLPLATLLRLSMLFPDHAPSRLKVARRFAGSRAIAQELEKAARHGVTGNRQQAAETILALVGALGEYDSRTRGHSERTQLYVTMLAEELGLKAEDRGRLMWAALVHDIGKLKVPHEVLNKPGKPTEDEWHILHSHPVQGAAICEPLREWLGEWWLAIEQHHEKYDGTGYPRGLAGKEISYGARIVAVADSYEVMTAARAYKRPMSAEAARQELIRCAGTHFDPDVVRAFLNISLGGMSRLSGPLAWLAQIMLIRPGPMMGQVLGAGAAAATTATTVAALSLVPAAAQTIDHHTAVGGETTAPSGQRSTPPGPATPTDAEPSSATPTPTTPTSGEPGSAPTTTSVPTSTSGTPSDDPSDPPRTDGTPTSTSPTTPTTTTSLTVHDDSLTTDEDASAVVDVVANDTAPEGPVTIVDVGRPRHGVATLGVGGTIRYAPDADFSGADSLTYTARDDGGDTAVGTVDVIVLPVNDAPVAVDDAGRRAGDSAPETLRPLANDVDVDGDRLSLSAVSDPQHGTIVQLAEGGIAYTPAADFNGQDHLTYTASDGHGGSATGSLTFVVTPVNDAPVVGPAAYAAMVGLPLSVGAADGVLANAADVDGDDLRVVDDSSPAIDIRPNGSFTYLPLAIGTRTVTFRVSDGTTTATGTMTITVSLLAASEETLYLQPADTDEIGSIDNSAPAGGVTDWDHDGHPGLTVRKSGLKASENDPRKYQTWSYTVPAGGLDLNGPVSLDLWTSLENRAHEDLAYAVWIDDCGPGGGSCTNVLSTGRVIVTDWSTTATWERRSVTLGAVSEDIVHDHLVRVRLMFDRRDVWLPLDGTHPAKVVFTTG